jgi:antitoxin (DNA-binding transcriptional repressor) of toxin-antitoxin stability system
MGRSRLLASCMVDEPCEFLPMHTVTLEHARIHFDSLVEEAAGGEEIVIESGHNALVRLLPAVPAAPRRQALAEWLERTRQRPAPQGVTTDGLLKETRSEI